MTARSAIVLAVSIAVLAAPVAAGAALPSTKKGTDIVLGRSIGGVKIGQSRAAAKAAWGAGGVCPTGALVTCFWADAKRSDVGSGQFSVEGGTVTTVQLTLGSSATTKGPKLDTPLRSFKTGKGVRLGSKLAAVLRAYPRNTKFKDGAGKVSDVKVTGPGKAFTIFTIRFGVVTSLRVDDGAPRG